MTRSFGFVGAKAAITSGMQTVIHRSLLRNEMLLSSWVAANEIIQGSNLIYCGVSKGACPPKRSEGGSSRKQESQGRRKMFTGVSKDETQPVLMVNRYCNKNQLAGLHQLSFLDIAGYSFALQSCLHPFQNPHIWKSCLPSLLLFSLLLLVKL